MYKCWNCLGFKLIPSEYPLESDADSESFAYGEECPICHGQPWLIVLAKKLIQAIGQKLKLLYNSEVFGLIGCSIIITIIFFGLVLIL